VSEREREKRRKESQQERKILGKRKDERDRK
jgi:hypothetical protein